MSKKKSVIGMPSIEPGMNKKVPGDPAPPAKAKSEMPIDVDLKSDEERKVHAKALKRFEKCTSASAANHARALEDLKFKNGEQWDANVAAQRAMDRRPCLTINTVPTITHQITNDIRENKPSIHVSPIGNKTDKESAEIFAGVIRSIERDSAADIAYDTAITSAVDIGFGYVRILTEYEAPDSLDQVITIKRVRNPFSVYLDPMRQEPDGADCEYAFVSEWLTREEFEDMYPDADQMNWDIKSIGDASKGWVNKDTVRIVEYFCIEREEERLVQLSNGFTGLWKDLHKDVKDKVKSGEIRILAERQTKIPKVVWRKLSGVEVLEKKDWAGKWIPIVEFLGEEIEIEGKVTYSGIIRGMKDSQRMKNFHASYKTEILALSPKAPYLGAHGQFEGHEDNWKAAINRSLPYLEYNTRSLDGGEALPPPTKVPPIQLSQGLVEAEQATERDMMTTSGIKFISTPTNERLQDESGLALREMRRNNDIGSFHYADNAARSMRQVGRILLDLVPKIYDTQRVLTIIREDGSESRVVINPVLNQASQHLKGKVPNENLRTLFNPKVGEYGVTITVGPSYATKRIEAHDQMLKLAQAMPQVGQFIADLIVKYSDWTGADEISNRLAKMLPPQALIPDSKDIPPQVQVMLQNFQKQIAQLTGERMQMLRDLTDNRADQATKRLKVENDYKAKVLKIITDLQQVAMTLTPEQIGAVDALSLPPPGFPAGIPDPMQPMQAPPGAPGNPLQSPQQLIGRPGNVRQVPPMGRPPIVPPVAMP